MDIQVNGSSTADGALEIISNDEVIYEGILFRIIQFSCLCAFARYERIRVLNLKMCDKHIEEFEGKRPKGILENLMKRI